MYTLNDGINKPYDVGKIKQKEKYMIYKAFVILTGLTD